MPELPEGVKEPEEAVEALAERNAISSLWGWWDDTPNRAAKEARQRERYAQLAEGVKDTWRAGAREQIASVLPAILPAILAAERERVRAALDEARGIAQDINDYASGRFGEAMATGSLQPDDDLTLLAERAGRLLAALDSTKGDNDAA